MGSDARVTKNTRHSYATRSNLIKKVLTPGGRHSVQILTKKSKGVMCGDCGGRLPGIKKLKATAYKNLKKRERTVSRAYGGSKCAGCVRDRIVRAFLIEEQKIVKKMLAEKAKQAKK
ncbi:hypothetical protein TrVE_jg1954 [Triparma verrucosa]|uniref:60S ribosomal protein L34 n=2 Tax=Triparma TaxID=722752 RepID=A0A9W7F4M2_9STRA|nr:hypothetical protein TrVE_jg1954 [Triparma verrucosa]GMI00724.1 hypothetical protein TrST_g8827 [Triparma strigata]|mmetsp:Transcript_19244/g.35746  ORF Transcript_19244/g.35746 Transcript_19244/m.35746 type:complete len:117 (-) Transcript_19244:35-385(-)|eukprot:CAMPEP_0182499392 /NCGR_PEP_ID=MMETSP1321-20130603/7621_1 /TAXON_ID=91990 /ORGANISM="Bolidomonas sp., Strain RCC1657" /LENGTH=116 /DNA_ID=CAMNT_0024703583 /DNA_START=40 /DNA_END=390 /DNA_ORIENTATION=+